MGSHRSKLSYFLDIAESVAMGSTCMRTWDGAVIVKDDVIVATGCNGAPHNCPGCSDMGQCPGELLNLSPQEVPSYCMAVHAEMNAMISASRDQMAGASIYLVSMRPRGKEYFSPYPCLACQKMLLNSGISHFYGRTYSPEVDAVVDQEMTITVQGVVRLLHEEYIARASGMGFESAVPVVNFVDKFVEVMDAV